MENRPVVSLCIPTNGVPEWVFPVLDSIYKQNVDKELFEVVVTDNGQNAAFQEQMRAYAAEHRNLVYEQTQAPLFLNEIESYKRARGELIKFVNHRTMLVEGALSRLIDFVAENRNQKPIVYFSNGAIGGLEKRSHIFGDFDSFVRALSYWSTWSTGMTIWKEDFDKLPEGTVFNALFPHTTILFHQRSRDKYIIDNSVIMDELPTGKKPKGKYDLFYAFAVEYPGILLNLRMDGSISTETFLVVKQANLGFIAEQYFEFVVRKRYCSYDLSGYDQSIRAFYSHWQMNWMLTRLIIRKIRGKLAKMLGKRV